MAPKRLLTLDALHADFVQNRLVTAPSALLGFADVHDPCAKYGFFVGSGGLPERCYSPSSPYRSWQQRQQGRQLHLVSTAWSPFTNAPGQPRFALDLVDVALERVGIIAETVIVDEARLTPSLLSGEFDGSAALWRDTERERALIYSQPYLENRLILVGRQGSDVSATSLADLAGKRIALVAGYAYGEAVETTDGPIFVGSNSEEDSVARLLNGEVDYTLMDDIVIQYLISQPRRRSSNAAGVRLDAAGSHARFTSPSAGRFRTPSRSSRGSTPSCAA